MARGKRQKAFILFDQGMTPSDPQVKELGIKRDTLHRYFRSWQSNNPNRTTTDNVDSPSGTRSGSPSSPPTTVTPDKTPGTFIRVVPKVTIIGYTPIMQRAQEAAINEMGWPLDMPLEDFLDTVLYHYFKRKGIRLEAYVVEKPSGKEN